MKNVNLAFNVNEGIFYSGIINEIDSANQEYINPLAVI